ncbi:MAG: hypothetical protein U1F53_21220 [Burkholderiaceae bacterium]
MPSIPALKPLLVSCALAALAATAHAAPVTNADLIKLLDAGMSEEVLLQAIASGQPRFDTSADALVQLKAKGATPAVLKAVLGAAPSAAAAPNAATAAATTAAPAAKPAPVAASATLNPEEVLVVSGGQESPMQYLLATMRTAPRALGFGGMATYATLRGSTASRRLPAQGLEFIVSIPKNAQAASYVTIANFAQRNNGTREVAIGGGYMSYTSGISRDRVVPIKAEPLADQSRAREGFVLHRVTPETALKPGEYAVVLYTSEVRVVGFFSQAVNSYFDFGVGG